MSVLRRLAAEGLELQELRAIPADRWPRQLPAPAPTHRERMAAGTPAPPQAKAAGMARSEGWHHSRESWRLSVPLLRFLSCATWSKQGSKTHWASVFSSRKMGQ